uniref:Wax synthase domain-containing protein n=1 Tax=Chlamydomonas leiostraca TaxID=1034604 RepID=A0A7S0RTS8_9CHLO|mmetsp:Transcript_31022/g.79128  ORF Transcript_31022/g.79128 Transcript_31022/m.79128 type:complete len:125 (+) Transcript_31022:3-377(+)
MGTGGSAQVQRKLTPAAAPATASSSVRTARAVGVLASFVASGLIHEYMCWAALGAAHGTQLLFFTLHGVAAVAERALCVAPNRAATVLFCVLTCPLFVWPWVLAGYVYRFPSPLPALVHWWAAL